MQEYKYVNTSNGMLPSGPPKAATFTINLSLQNPYIISLTQSEAQGLLKTIQSIYVDNSSNSAATTVSVQNTGQKLIIPPNDILISPLFVDSNQEQITISSPGTSTIKIILLDIPLEAFKYNTTGTINIPTPLEISATNTANSAANPLYTTSNISNTTLEVSATTAPNTTSNPIYVEQSLNRQGKLFSQALTTTTAVIAIPAVAANYIYLDNITLALTPNSTVATAGIVNVNLIDNATTVLTFGFYVPATAITGVEMTSITIPLKYTTAAVDTPVSLNLSVALTAGQINYVINGNYTTLP